jgi:phosphohistidine phosphatase
MKTLIILRHGHAESKNPVTNLDYDRNLDERGRGEILKAALALRAIAHGRTIVLASAAKRTHQTAEILAAELDSRHVEVHKNLYHAMEEDWLDAVSNVEDDFDTAILVGHNPTLSNLASRLSGKEMDLLTAGWLALRAPKAWAYIKDSDWVPVVM